MLPGFVAIQDRLNKQCARNEKVAHTRIAAIKSLQVRASSAILMDGRQKTTKVTLSSNRVQAKSVTLVNVFPCNLYN